MFDHLLLVVRRFVDNYYSLIKIEKKSAINISHYRQNK